MPTGVYIRTKPKIGLKKENSSNWKGGITPLHRKIRNCTKYKKWRKSVFDRDNYTCQICNKKGSGNLNADHYPIPFSTILRDFIAKVGVVLSYDSYEECNNFWDVSNGRTLCELCHQSIVHNAVNRVPAKNGKKFQFITFNEETHTLRGWAKKLNIPEKTIGERRKRGLPVEDILSTKTLHRKTKRTIFVEYNGEKKPLKDWCDQLGLNYLWVTQRINRYNWTPEEAFTKPTYSVRSNRKFNDGSSQIGKKQPPERIAKARESFLSTMKKRRMLPTNSYNPISHQFNYKKAA